MLTAPLDGAVFYCLRFNNYPPSGRFWPFYLALFAKMELNVFICIAKRDNNETFRRNIIGGLCCLLCTR